jgi:hypothetical protein
MKVWVCVWDATHTLDRVEKQQVALADGTIKKLIKAFGTDTPELREAMEKLGLLSRTDTDRGPVCPVCDSLMDEVLSRQGMTDRLAAVRDVAEDFGAAIDRTRAARI